jgi:hypothetical protein
MPLEKMDPVSIEVLENPSPVFYRYSAKKARCRLVVGFPPTVAPDLEAEISVLYADSLQPSPNVLSMVEKCIVGHGILVTCRFNDISKNHMGRAFVLCFLSGGERVYSTPIQVLSKFTRQASSKRQRRENGPVGAAKKRTMRNIMLSTEMYVMSIDAMLRNKIV